jgi:hypothetical protein
LIAPATFPVAHSRPLDREALMLTTPAPAPVASPPPSMPLLEQVIGEIAASAALEIARALREHQNNGLSFRNAVSAFGDRVAQLFELRQICAGQIDFYTVVRARGTHVLQQRYGKDINARTIAVLADAVIEVLQHVVRAELN